ncbi:MAG: DegT/DnrJ/EryC1/StrS family aminotransferase [Myxococcota bacterium]|nr:DegT/DnrJ/EryC1/StrS family aminotransferase [Myxococcota bacterium]
MYVVGEEEVQAVAEVIRSGRLFRYGIGGECDRFERRYAGYLGVDHCALTASGSYALTAALVGLSVGPGDEVLVPAHTYMATATAVLSAGAIPVVVDIDESLTLDPSAMEAAIGPRTRAVIPVHMWGTAADLDALCEIARRRGLHVIEDACQGVGGGHRGRPFGTIGDAGAFSFNYYKNMTAGEGGALVTRSEEVAERARCLVDPCHFYWNGRSDSFKPFAAIGARPSELMAAMLNVQLDRIDALVEAMRDERDRILEGTRPLRALGLEPAPLHSPESDCATQVFFTLPSAEQARAFTEVLPSVIAGQTGRHNYTEWDPILTRKGAPHPALDPYRLPENAECRHEVTKDQCPRSLDILSRSVMIATRPDHRREEVEDRIHDIGVAARVALGDLPREQARIRNPRPVDREKFDLDDAAQATP